MKQLHTMKKFVNHVPTDKQMIDWYSDGSIKLTHASNNELEAINADGACEWHSTYTKEHLCTCLEVY